MIYILLVALAIAIGTTAAVGAYTASGLFLCAWLGVAFVAYLVKRSR